MSLLELADKAKDVKEPQAQPDGEYKLEITKVEDGESGPNAKTPGKPFTRFYFKVVNPKVSPAKLLNSIIMHVTADTPEDQADMRALELKRLMTAFKLTKSDLAPDNYPKLKGKTAWASLIETEDDPKYGISNEIRRWVVSDDN